MCNPHPKPAPAPAAVATASAELQALFAQGDAIAKRLRGIAAAAADNTAGKWRQIARLRRVYLGDEAGAVAAEAEAARLEQYAASTREETR